MQRKEKRLPAIIPGLDLSNLYIWGRVTQHNNWEVKVASIKAVLVNYDEGKSVGEKFHGWFGKEAAPILELRDFVNKLSDNNEFLSAEETLELISLIVEMKSPGYRMFHQLEQGIYDAVCMICRKLEQVICCKHGEDVFFLFKLLWEKNLLSAKNYNMICDITERVGYCFRGGRSIKNGILFLTGCNLLSALTFDMLCFGVAYDCSGIHKQIKWLFNCNLLTKPNAEILLKDPAFLKRFVGLIDSIDERFLRQQKSNQKISQPIFDLLIFIMHETRYHKNTYSNESLSNILVMLEINKVVNKENFETIAYMMSYRINMSELIVTYLSKLGPFNFCNKENIKTLQEMLDAPLFWGDESRVHTFSEHKERKIARDESIKEFSNNLVTKHLERASKHNESTIASIPKDMWKNVFCFFDENQIKKDKAALTETCKALAEMKMNEQLLKK